MCNGEQLGAFALTEKEAGSDAGNVQTTATPSEEGYQPLPKVVTQSSYCPNEKSRSDSGTIERSAATLDLSVRRRQSTNSTAVARMSESRIRMATKKAYMRGARYLGYAQAHKFSPSARIE